MLIDFLTFGLLPLIVFLLFFINRVLSRILKDDETWLVKQFGKNRAVVLMFISILFLAAGMVAIALSVDEKVIEIRDSMLPIPLSSAAVCVVLGILGIAAPARRWGWFEIIATLTLVPVAIINTICLLCMLRFKCLGMN